MGILTLIYFIQPSVICAAEKTTYSIQTGSLKKLKNIFKTALKNLSILNSLLNKIEIRSIYLAVYEKSYKGRRSF